MSNLGDYCDSLLVAQDCAGRGLAVAPEFVRQLRSWLLYSEHVDSDPIRGMAKEQFLLLGLSALEQAERFLSLAAKGFSE